MSRRLTGRSSIRIFFSGPTESLTGAVQGQRRAVLLMKTSKIRTMKKLPAPVVLCALSWCFTGGSGGNTTALYYCTKPGCALNVTTVFCGDESVPFNSPMEECTGPPPPNTVCQSGGRAFVSTDTSGACEFENTAHIPTQRCTDNTDACDFTSGTTPSPLTSPESVIENQRGPRTYYILAVPGVILVVLVVLVGLGLKWIKNKESDQQPQSDAVVHC